MGPTRTAAAFWASGASSLPDSGADCPMARRSMRKGLSGTAGSAAAAWFGLRRMERSIESSKPRHTTLPPVLSAGPTTAPSTSPAPASAPPPAIDWGAGSLRCEPKSPDCRALHFSALEQRRAAACPVASPCRASAPGAPAPLPCRPCPPCLVSPSPPAPDRPPTLHCPRRYAPGALRAVVWALGCGRIGGLCPVAGPVRAVAQAPGRANPGLGFAGVAVAGPCRRPTAVEPLAAGLAAATGLHRQPAQHARARGAVQHHGTAPCALAAGGPG